LILKELILIHGARKKNTKKFAFSNILRIHLKNGYKNILLTDCDIKKVKLIIYGINIKIVKSRKPKMPEPFAPKNI